MAGAWHPVDLHEGLPHAVPGAELHEAGRRSHRGLPPGRRADGLRQVDGMPRKSQRARSRAGRGTRKAPRAPTPIHTR